MIALQDRQLVYEFLMLELAIRSLQYDIDNMKHLKFAELYFTQLDGVLKNLQVDYHWRRKKLVGKKIRFYKWVKVDDYFTDAILATDGEDVVIRFSTHVLKQNSQLLIEQKMLPIIHKV
ncbi:aconitate hydratase [Solibacillus daqui]|uniref:aconitate hydratase n=1 Tax=Solibacillus daqui TaxID=2912187 RepID=UPI002366239B|nr:aconitate hydratase [Solibacillus daqui]